MVNFILSSTNKNIFVIQIRATCNVPKTFYNTRYKMNRSKRVYVSLPYMYSTSDISNVTLDVCRVCVRVNVPGMSDIPLIVYSTFL